MPDGSEAGPTGPGCVEGLAAPPGLTAKEPTAVSQPGMVERVVVLREEPTQAAEPTMGRGDMPASLPLTAGPRGTGATTTGTHVHERWSESRKLELSYCISGMPGDDAELEAAYHKTIRALASTMAEWERVTGANFVHVAEDDTPATRAYVIQQGRDLIARADCVAGTKAYFGIISVYTGDRQAVTNTSPQTWNDPVLEPVAGNLGRTILLNKDLIAAYAAAQPPSTWCSSAPDPTSWTSPSSTRASRRAQSSGPTTPSRSPSSAASMPIVSTATSCTSTAPGDDGDAAMMTVSGNVTVMTAVAQQSAYAYPIAAPYRGSGFPDDIVWLEPLAERVTTWRLAESGVLELAESARLRQDRLGLVPGEHIPYVGDFDADGCHDIAWFDAVADQLHVWRCLPGARDFDCGATMPTPPDAAPVGMHWGF